MMAAFLQTALFPGGTPADEGDRLCSACGI